MLQPTQMPISWHVVPVNSAGKSQHLLFLRATWCLTRSLHCMQEPPHTAMAAPSTMCLTQRALTSLGGTCGTATIRPLSFPGALLPLTFWACCHQVPCFRVLRVPLAVRGKTCRPSCKGCSLCCLTSSSGQPVPLLLLCLTCMLLPNV